MRHRRFRIKVVPECGDCHYFYADNKEEADIMYEALEEDLEGLSVVIFMYVDTRYGHVRVR